MEQTTTDDPDLQAKLDKAIATRTTGDVVEIYYDGDVVPPLNQLEN